MLSFYFSDPKIETTETKEVIVEEKLSKQSTSNTSKPTTSNTSTTTVFRLITPNTNSVHQLNPSLSDSSDKGVNDDKDEIDIIYIPLDESSNDAQSITETNVNTPMAISDGSDDDRYLLPKRQRRNNGQAIQGNTDRKNDSTTASTSNVLNMTAGIKTTTTLVDDDLVTIDELIELEEASEDNTMTILPSSPATTTKPIQSKKPAKTQRTSSTKTQARSQTTQSAKTKTTSQAKPQLVEEKTVVGDSISEESSNGIASELSKSLLARASPSGNEETYFALSIVEILKRLPHKKRAIAKCHIITYLTELEYGS